MEFEWDENKNLRNLAKHRIGFEEAIEVFDDLHELTEPANTVGHEERLKTIGKVASLAVLLVVHTSGGAYIKSHSRWPSNNKGDFCEARITAGKEAL